MQRRVVAAVWLAGIVAVCGAGFVPDGYLRHVRQFTDPQPYPAFGVVQCAAIVTVEVVVLAAVLGIRSRRVSWRRAAAASVLAGALLLLFGMTLLHAPPYQVAHVWWLLAVTAALSVATAVSAATSVRRRHRIASGS